MREIIDEIIGWYGTFVTILAYALVSFGYLSSMAVSYQILNLIGAFGILHISLKKKVYQSTAVNIIWGIIALIAIVNLLI